jgi:hypothetical protein
VINGNLVKKWENEFIDDDYSWVSKFGYRRDDINIPQSNDIGFCAFNLLLYVLQIVGT